MEHPSEAVARVIEDAIQRRDTDALRGVIERAATALLRCYPLDRGPDILWAVFRTIAGPESPGAERKEG